MARFCVKQLKMKLHLVLSQNSQINNSLIKVPMDRLSLVIVSVVTVGGLFCIAPVVTGFILVAVIGKAISDHNRKKYRL